MPRATPVLRDNAIGEQGNILELVIGRVPTTPRSSSGVRYRLAFVRRGEEKPAVLYDNHSSKGHNRHVEGIEESYSFSGIHQLPSELQDRRATDHGRQHMAKKLRIQIKSAGEALEGFRDAFTAVEGGRRIRRQGVYFTSIEAARNLLTPNRLALLRAVRSGRPGSIYELAKMVSRDLKNVQDDLRLLETYGLIRMADAMRSGKRRVRVPQAVFDQIELKIAI